MEPLQTFYHHAFGGEGDARPVNSISISPDGKRFVSYSGQKEHSHVGFVVLYKFDGKIWSTCSSLSRTRDNPGNNNSLALGKDGQLAFNTEKDEIRVRDGDGKIIHSFSGQKYKYFAFSPDSQKLASGGYDGSIKVWDLKSKPFSFITGNDNRSLNGHSEEVLSIVFSSDGQSLFSGSRDGTVKAWDLKTGQLLRSIDVGHQPNLRGIAISPDTTFAVSSDNNIVKIWDLTDGELLLSHDKHNSWILPITISPDSNFVATGSMGDKEGSAEVILWNVRTGTMNTFTGYTDRITSLAITPDNSMLIVGGGDGEINIWKP